MFWSSMLAEACICVCVLFTDMWIYHLLAILVFVCKFTSLQIMPQWVFCTQLVHICRSARISNGNIQKQNFLSCSICISSTQLLLNCYSTFVKLLIAVYERTISPIFFPTLDITRLYFLTSLMDEYRLLFQFTVPWISQRWAF